MREGQDLQVVCEVYGARPVPVISWHRSGSVVRGKAHRQKLKCFYPLNAQQYHPIKCLFSPLALPLRYTDSQIVEDHNGLFTVKSTLSLTLSRQELGATYICRVEMKELSLVVDNHFHIDLQGKRTGVSYSENSPRRHVRWVEKSAHNDAMLLFQRFYVAYTRKLFIRKISSYVTKLCFGR